MRVPITSAFGYCDATLVRCRATSGVSSLSSWTADSRPDQRRFQNPTEAAIENMSSLCWYMKSPIRCEQI